MKRLPYNEFSDICTGDFKTLDRDILEHQAIMHVYAEFYPNSQLLKKSASVEPSVSVQPSAGADEEKES